MSNEDVIEAGKTVVIQKYKYMRTHVLNPKKPLQMGRDMIDITPIVGCKFGTTFKMIPDTKKKVFSLEICDAAVDLENLEDLFLGEGGQDNRDLNQAENSQKLSRDDIEEMRDEGKSGEQILGKLIENSETFQNKTKFSQAKFLKKKAKKYHHFILIRKPSIRLLMQIHYTANPMNLMNLRLDSLAQLLNMTNIHSGGRFLVYETGAQGVVVAAVLERVGASGKVVHIYQTGQPQTSCLSAMNFTEQVTNSLHTINIQHLRSQEQGKDILVNHYAPNPNGEPPKKKLCVDEVNLPVPADKTEVNLPVPADKTEVLPVPVDKTEVLPVPADKTEVLPVRMTLRERSVSAFQEISSRDMDGLIIVCKQHPTALLLHLLKYLAPSRPFSVFSPYKEPLMDAYMAVKEAGIAILCTVSETWLSYQQVLPGRTHPEMLMSGGGGYLLTGTFVEKS